MAVHTGHRRGELIPNILHATTYYSVTQLYLQQLSENTASIIHDRNLYLKCQQRSNCSISFFFSFLFLTRVRTIYVCVYSYTYIQTCVQYIQRQTVINVLKRLNLC